MTSVPRYGASPVKATVPAVIPMQYLTPREVERRYPALTRPELAERRSLGLPPRFKLVAGCVKYSTWEIGRFLATIGPGADDQPQKEAAPRCAIYARASSLSHPSEPISSQVKACEAHQRDKGWEFASACVDFGPPNTAKRMLGGFRQLLKEAAEGEIDLLLVPSRAHISTHARSYRHFCEALKRAGVEIRELDRLKANSGSKLKHSISGRI